MQGFIIFCKFFFMYRADTVTKAGTWDGALAVLGFVVVFTNISLGWFNLAEAYWSFPQEQKFDAIVGEIE